MRIRRKKRLNERLEAVAEYLVVADKEVLNVSEAIKEKAYFDFGELFKNDNPVSVEIGCGKGGYICALSTALKNENFFAVEMLENIILSGAEEAKKLDLKNLLFINSGAEYLPKYFADESVQNIMLNFSPPYPKKVNENRRLTNARNVFNYYKMLKRGGSVFQKTDDKDFFDYSKEKLGEAGFIVTDFTNAGCEIELPVKLKIETEYEKKFSSLGMKIYRLEAVKPLS